MKVSILAAVHNEEAHLREMVSSVISQTHQDWELLLVDDGSTDGTDGQIVEAAMADGRVKRIGDGSRVGKVAAFNRAFSASSGDVIVLLGGDDRLTPRSLLIRSQALIRYAPKDFAIGRFKLRTLSLDRRVDGNVLPRGGLVSSSGGVIAMTRAVANVAFPIDATLVSEDLWIAAVAEDAATIIVDVPEVVLEYRIHSGNSNPRGRNFEEMSAAMASRHRAWEILADSESILSDAGRARVARKARLEGLRSQGAVWEILKSRSTPISERLAFSSMADKRLFRLRQRFFILFSGRRT